MRAIICDVCGTQFFESAFNETIKTVTISSGALFCKELDLCNKCEAKMWNALKREPIHAPEAVKAEKPVTRKEPKPEAKPKVVEHEVIRKKYATSPDKLHTLICKSCGNPFTSKFSNALTCSSKCYQRYWTAKNKQVISTAPTATTVKPSVDDLLLKLKTENPLKEKTRPQFYRD